MKNMRKASDVGVPKLYHYQPFNSCYLKDTLKNAHVHFSSPSNFNDPWDCCPKYAMGDETQETVRRWEKYFHQFADNLSSEQQLHLDALQPGEYIAFLKRSIDFMTRHSRKRTSDMWRIFCLTPDPASILMWSHYATNHTGLCLEFDVRMPVIGGAFKVIYERNRPIIDSHILSNELEMAKMMTLVKSDCWDYEQEFRILCRNGDLDKAPTATLCKTEGDFLQLPPDALTRVIVGCRGDFDAAKKLVEAHRPGLAVHQATQSDDEYKLVIPEHSC